MFSQLSERRFPKDTRRDVGPGSYEVASLLNTSTCGASMLDLDASTFSIFVDEDASDTSKNPPRTPRSARKPFGKTTKENIMNLSVKSKGLGDEKAKSENSNECVKELQKTVEKLESKCRNLQLKIDFEGEEEGAEAETAEIKRKLMRSSEEKEHLRELLEASTERVQSLEAAAANLPTDPSEVAAFVEKLVMHELANPRKVFCLQRKVWEDQVKSLQEQTDRLENQMDNRSKFYHQREQEALLRASVAENVAAEEQAKAVEAESKAAEWQARAAEAECRAIEAECKLTAGAEQEEELQRLREEVVRLEALAETSLQEEQRLKEMVAVTQDAIQRYREREAELAGHTNHHQKIKLHMKMKKENDTLRSEVERLQKELFRPQPPRQHRQTAVASPASSRAAPAATAKARMDDRRESW